MKKKELTLIQIAEVMVMRVSGIILLIYREACSDEYIYQENWHLMVPMILGFMLFIAAGMLKFYYEGFFDMEENLDNSKNENTSGCNRQGK